MHRPQVITVTPFVAKSIKYDLANLSGGKLPTVEQIGQNFFYAGQQIIASTKMLGANELENYKGYVVDVVSGNRIVFTDSIMTMPDEAASQPREIPSAKERVESTIGKIEKAE